MNTELEELTMIRKELQNIRVILEYANFPKFQFRFDENGRLAKGEDGHILTDPQNPQDFLEKLCKDRNINL